MENLPQVLNNLEGSKYLLIAAHPDDEIFACGGLLYKLIKDGKEVDIFIFSKGEAWGNPEERVMESRNASFVIGYKEPIFFDFPDGKFIEKLKEIEEKLKEILLKEKYEGIFCPSFFEKNKDHKALAYSLIKILQSIRIKDSFQENFWNTMIYFYEIYEPQKVNLLFDISDLIEKKIEAIRSFNSQLRIKDFERLVLGLNAYRTFTLSKDYKYVEGYLSYKFQDILKFPITEFVRDGEFYEAPNISIGLVIRTKNRPFLLKEALNSVKNCLYKLDKIIVVNDGEMEFSLEEYKDSLPIEILKCGKGRSFAANLGIKQLKTDFVAFLDDDDLFYPHHFNTLSKAIYESKGSLVYSDALSSIYEYNSVGGNYELKDKVISYSMDFDRDLLLYDNYIPLITILFERKLFDTYGYFNENLDIFEDWELLIRFSRKTFFYHIKEITCEYRNFKETHSLGFEPEKKDYFHKKRAEVLEITKNYRSFEIEEKVIKNLKDENFELKRNLEIKKVKFGFYKKR